MTATPIRDHLSAETRPVVRVSAETARDTVAQVLRIHGAAETEALIQADMLIEGDLRGQHSHGVRRVMTLAGRLASGATTSGIAPRFTWLAEGRLHVEAHGGMGPVVAFQVLDALIPRAVNSGIAIASIRNAGHIGMLAPYVERIAERGCIGIALTVSEALVAPWGGSRAMVGTNPIGIGVPTEGKPLVLDMSTAAASAGKIIDYAARGEQLPEGWAVDAEGHPTTDAASAVNGAIAPFGGSKGYALGLAFEALVGLLAGSAFGRDVSGTLDTEAASTKGDVFIVIPADGAALPALTAYLDLLRHEGTESSPVMIPGDRARRVRAERLRDGIPLDAELWRQIETLATPPTGRTR